ncbi:MAG: hypothetical protein ACMXX9_02910 [Candidatus Woesearchaeota archaeon]
MILNKAKKTFMHLALASYKIKKQKREQRKLILKSIEKEIFVADQILASMKNKGKIELYQKNLEKINRLKKIIKKFDF